ncbi:MAG TPA: hypothetical protein VHD87_00560 [Acidimicrobiales bacterium]|nr:hypothetical protein [Acidimicrobiales bacterium]
MARRLAALRLEAKHAGLPINARNGGTQTLERRQARFKLRQSQRRS